MTGRSSRDDPYHDKKTYHKAHLFSPSGQVSALCFARPRAIDLQRALWTIRDDAVTCPKCLRLLAATKSQAAKTAE